MDNIIFESADGRNDFKEKLLNTLESIDDTLKRIEQKQEVVIRNAVSSVLLGDKAISNE